jgi:ABC-type glycerol-3-phosphate transport system permease component
MAFVPVTAPTGAAVASRRSASAADRPVGGRNPLALAIGHLALIALAVFSIFPVYWMYATSLRRPEDALDQTPFPWPISIENFTTVWESIPLAGMLANTFAMSLGLAVAQLFIAVLAAYALAVWTFPGRKVMRFLFVGSWLVPFQVTMIPNYLLVSQMGLLGTLGGVIVPQLSAAFAVLLMVQHMSAFPRELLDAAQMDGRNSWTTLWSIVVPNMKPALAALGIMGFISAWNEYLWPMLIMRDGSALIQTGLRAFLGDAGNDWGATMAAAGMATLPVLLIYVFLQRYVVDAFVRSGLK